MNHQGIGLSSALAEAGKLGRLWAAVKGGAVDTYACLLFLDK